MGRVQRDLQEKMKASEWAFDRIKEAFELVPQDEPERVSIVQEIMLKSTDYHRASRRTGWSHNVLPVPELQKFPSGRLRLVGLWRKDHKVVRDVWRKVRMEEHAFSLTNK